jgi:hypothetical protein
MHATSLCLRMKRARSPHGIPAISTYVHGERRACPQVNNTDYPGNDVGTSEPAETFDECFASCCANPQCGGVLWEAKADISMGGCTKGSGCCWQKSAMGNSRSKPPSVGAVAAAVDGRHPAPAPPVQPTLAEVKAPPMGYRSSPALGGVAAGSTELRADG